MGDGSGKSALGTFLRHLSRGGVHNQSYEQVCTMNTKIKIIL